MHPILFTILGLPVYTYGVALALAFLMASILVARRAPSVGIHGDRVYDMTMCIVVAAIFGARLGSVLTEPGSLSGGWLSFFNLRSGGLVFQGGLIGGILAGVAYCKFSRTDPWAMAEIVPAPLALAYSFGRVFGCFFNGCCYGLPTRGVFGVVFPTVDSLHRHPTQLYEALGGLAIFAVLIAVRRHRMFKGFPMFLFVALYAFERFFVEFFRDRPIVDAGLGLAQYISIGAFAAAVIAIAYLQRVRGSGESAGAGKGASGK